MQTHRLTGISRYRWTLVMTAALLITAVFSLPPLVDAAHPDSPVAASLQRSVAYEAIAPVSNVLDSLTMLSPAQYWATFALCALVFFGWVLVHRRRSWLRLAFRFVGGTVAIIGIMLVMKRPMASLRLTDPNELAVDFHSHTSASHDGRAGFDAEHNRSWHAGSGFDVAYVTDHRTFDGALRGMAGNPAVAGSGTVLLPGVELREGDQHPILIGVDPRRMRITSPDWKEAAVEADGGPAPPILILSLPGNIQRIPPNMTSGPVRLAAVEVSDGCPRGLAQSEQDHDSLLALAATLGLATVSASDNHGWGRAAPAWSVMRIPGWRTMSPSQLDVAIRHTIITGGTGAVRVIARRPALSAKNPVAVAFGGVAVAAMTLRTMNFPDRFSWLAWCWSIQLLSVGMQRRRRVKRGTRIPINTPRSGEEVEAAA